MDIAGAPISGSISPAYFLKFSTGKEEKKWFPFVAFEGIIVGNPYQQERVEGRSVERDRERERREIK